LWATHDLAELIKIGLGAFFGAIVASAVRRNRDTTSESVIVNVLVCTAAGILAIVGVRWLQFPLLVTVGFLSAAAPITLALNSPVINNGAEARQYLRRNAASVTLHVLAGIGYATLGYVCALAAVLAIDRTA
jgi:hypothetical protein